MVSYSQCNVLTGHHCVLEIIWSVIAWYLSYHMSFKKNMGVLNFFLCIYIAERELKDRPSFFSFFWRSLCNYPTQPFGNASLITFLTFTVNWETRFWVLQCNMFLQFISYTHGSMREHTWKLMLIMHTLTCIFSKLMDSLINMKYKFIPLQQYALRRFSW